MKLTNLDAFQSYFKRPKKLELDYDTVLYVKQLTAGEFKEFEERVKGLEGKDGEEGNYNHDLELDIMASLITDENGKPLFVEESDKEVLKQICTVDFSVKFWAKFNETYMFGSKELASAESKFRQ